MILISTCFFLVLQGVDFDLQKYELGFETKGKLFQRNRQEGNLMALFGLFKKVFSVPSSQQNFLRNVELN